MKKTYLLKYKSPNFLALKPQIEYKLHLEIVWFWGLFKTHKKLDYIIYDHQCCKAHFDHWDKLIADRHPLR